MREGGYEVGDHVILIRPQDGLPYYEGIVVSGPTPASLPAWAWEWVPRGHTIDEYRVRLIPPRGKTNGQIHTFLEDEIRPATLGWRLRLSWRRLLRKTAG